MTRLELRDLILKGENSYVEFKRDGVHPASLAKEMCALLNHRGGVILLGVEDNGEVSGISESHRSTEERIMNIAQNNIQPSVTPSFLSIKINDGRASFKTLYFLLLSRLNCGLNWFNLVGLRESSAGVRCFVDSTSVLPARRSLFGEFRPRSV